MAQLCQAIPKAPSPPQEGLLTNAFEASALAMAWVCEKNYPTLLDQGLQGLYLALHCSFFYLIMSSVVPYISTTAICTKVQQR